MKKNKNVLKGFAAGMLLILTAIPEISGCTAKDSGLYSINAVDVTSGEQTDRSVTGASESGDSGENITESSVTDTLGITGSGISAESSGTELMTPEDVTIFVHICGAVNNPGVYEFKTGDRVFDAVDAAGGFTEDASEDYVNLALELSDGCKIVIPTKEEAASEPEASSGEKEKETAGTGQYGITGSQEAGVTYSPGIQGEASSEQTDSEGRVNINTADAQTLMSLNGIGETRAAAILAYRDVHGEFEDTQDITNVSGIGDSTYDKIKDRITTGR